MTFRFNNVCVADAVRFVAQPSIVMKKTFLALFSTATKRSNDGKFQHVLSRRPGPRLFVTALAACAVVQLASGQSTWSGAGTDLNWSTSGNWSGGVPGNLSTVTFPDGVGPITTNVQGAANNIVQSSMSIASLTYNNQSAHLATTFIPVGGTLTVTALLSLGEKEPANVNTVVTTTGGGSRSAGTNGTGTWMGQNGSGQGA